MSQIDDFGKADRDGFEGLLRSSFFVFEGLLLTKNSTFRSEDALKFLETKSRHDFQRQYNHVSLFLYVADISIQREWADQLQARWMERMKTEFPHLDVHFDRTDNGQEVIVWFWNP